MDNVEVLDKKDEDKPQPWEEVDLEEPGSLDELLRRAYGEEDFNPTKFTVDRQKVFLEEYAKTGVISQAARAAGVAPSTVSRARDQSDTFDWAFNQAQMLAVGKLEAEAIRRAKDGYEVPVFQGGEEVGVQKYYSDGLLKFLLRAKRPDEYGKEQVEHSGSVKFVIQPPDDYDGGKAIGSGEE